MTEIDNMEIAPEESNPPARTIPLDRMEMSRLVQLGRMYTMWRMLDLVPRFRPGFQRKHPSSSENFRFPPYCKKSAKSSQSDN